MKSTQSEHDASLHSYSTIHKKLNKGRFLEAISFSFHRSILKRTPKL